MVNDPYKVLGITSQATPEEIKSAYRKMAKKYHPDLHPDDEEAARKMNEVNEAYDMLTHPEKYAGRRAEEQARQSSYGNYNNGYGFYGNQNTQRSNGYQGAGGWYSDFNGFDFEDLFGAFTRYANQNAYSRDTINPTPQPGDSKDVLNAINYINAGRYQEAFRTLMQIQHHARDARWYYLNGITLYGYGDVSQAAEYMTKAVQLEPGNTTYHTLLQQFRQEGRTYYRENTVFVNPFRRIGRFFMFIILIRIFFGFLQMLLYSAGGFFPPVM